MDDHECIDDFWPHDCDADDDRYEIIGSCDNCDCDIDEEDCYHWNGLQLCSYCCWLAMQR